MYFKSKSVLISGKDYKTEKKMREGSFNLK